MCGDKNRMRSDLTGLGCTADLDCCTPATPCLLVIEHNNDSSINVQNRNASTATADGVVSS